MNRMLVALVLAIATTTAASPMPFAPTCGGFIRACLGSVEGARRGQVSQL
jgi:hypothetical protein